jgi:hypothetical protein
VEITVSILPERDLTLSLSSLHHSRYTGLLTFAQDYKQRYIIDIRPKRIALYRKRDFPLALDFRGAGNRGQMSEARLPAHRASRSVRAEEKHTSCYASEMSAGSYQGSGIRDQRSRVSKLRKIALEGMYVYS